MRVAVVLTLALTLSGCASAGSGKLPVCDGRHRRPANPYGSVLDAPANAAPASVPPSAAAVGAGAAPAPKPAGATPGGCGA